MLKQRVRSHQTFIGVPRAWAGTDVVTMTPAELEENLAKAREEGVAELVALLDGRPQGTGVTYWRVGNTYYVHTSSLTREAYEGVAVHTCEGAGLLAAAQSLLAAVEAAKPGPKPVEGMTIEECAAECRRIMLQRDPREREHWCASPPAGLRHFWNVCYGVSRFGEGDSCLAAWQAAVRKLREEGS